jgi:hypothetical protein
LGQQYCKNHKLKSPLLQLLADRVVKNIVRATKQNKTIIYL